MSNASHHAPSRAPTALHELCSASGYLAAPSSSAAIPTVSFDTSIFDELELWEPHLLQPFQQDPSMSSFGSDTGYYSQTKSCGAPSDSATGYTSADRDPMASVSSMYAHAMSKQCKASGVAGGGTAAINLCSISTTPTPLVPSVVPASKVHAGMKRSQAHLSLSGLSQSHGQPAAKQPKHADNLSPMVVSESDRNAFLEKWRQMCISQGRDPIEDDAKVQAFSVLLGMSQAKIGQWFLTHISRTTDRSTTSRTPAATTSQEAQRLHKQQLAQEFAGNARGVPCEENPPIPSKGGWLKCTWGCDFAHDRPFDWKRHEELRQPQNFWLCADCYDSAAPHTFITERSDKFLSHARSTHHLQGSAKIQLRDRSKVDYDAGFDRICTHRITTDDICGYQFTGTWKERNDHWIQHFKEDFSMGDQDPSQSEHNNETDDNSGSSGAYQGHGQSYASRPPSNYSTSSSANTLFQGFGNHSFSYNNGPSWYADCIGGPTLLIDVQRTCLVRPTAGTKYLAVSYSWISNKPPASAVLEEGDTLQNIGIKCPLLLKSIQVTRDMGYGFVWIDALCQPNASEADEEQIFETASMVIVMASCPEVEGGICCFTCPYSGSKTIRGWLNERSTLQHVRTLGHGAYGIVDEVQLLPAKRNFARKILFRNNAQDPLHDRKPEELEVMQKLSRFEHPHIARFVAAYHDDRALNILMLPVAEGDLRHFLAEPEKWPGKTTHLHRWFLSLASALEYMHSVSCRHKDIKPANILISGNEVVLTDFGTSIDFSSSTSTSSGGAVMTPKYCAPEVARHDERGRSADIFSLGCVFVEMITVALGKTMSDLNDYLGVIDEAWRQKITYHQQIFGLRNWLRKLTSLVSTNHQSTILSLCAEMISANPAKRPSAQDVVESLCSSEIQAERKKCMCQCCGSVPAIGQLDARKPFLLKSGDHTGEKGLLSLLPLSQLHSRTWQLFYRRLTHASCADEHGLCSYLHIVSWGMQSSTSVSTAAWSWSQSSLAFSAQSGWHVIEHRTGLLLSFESLGNECQPVKSPVQGRTVFIVCELMQLSLLEPKSKSVTKLQTALRVISIVLAWRASSRHGPMTVKAHLLSDPITKLHAAVAPPSSDEHGICGIASLQATGLSPLKKQQDFKPPLDPKMRPGKASAAQFEFMFQAACTESTSMLQNCHREHMSEPAAPFPMSTALKLGKIKSYDSCASVASGNSTAETIEIGDLGCISMEAIFTALARRNGRCSCHSEMPLDGAPGFLASVEIPDAAHVGIRAEEPDTMLVDENLFAAEYTLSSCAGVSTRVQYVSYVDVVEGHRNQNTR